MNIVIVGSSRGIGHALAMALVRDGHTVYGIARSKQAPLANPGFVPLEGNILVENNYREIKAVDALIFCAGSQPPIGPSMEIDPHDWFFGVRDNLLAAFNAIHTFYPRLRRAERKGKIVLFSGGGATQARPNLSAYACAKTAIVRLVETLSEEWEEEGRIDINAIAPGAIATAMTEEILDSGLAGHKELSDALKTMKQDNEAALAKVVGCVRWLISPASDGITGRLVAAKWDDWQNTKPENLSDKGWKLRRLI